MLVVALSINYVGVCDCLAHGIDQHNLKDGYRGIDWAFIGSLTGKSVVLSILETPYLINT